jgi:hypothetical protein
MNMAKKLVKRIGLIILGGIIIAMSAGAYLWFKPHRNVQATKAFAELKVNELVSEFSADANAANVKYLANDGNSKVLIIEGRVSKITTNQTGEKVIILKDEGAKAGVSATFTQNASPNAEFLNVGDIIKVKGAIISGNSYNADFDLYEHAILVQCDIIK